MTPQSAKPCSTKHSRCRHCTVTGRRCRLRAQDPRAGLCFRHAGLQHAQSDADDLTTAFDGQLTDFKSAVQINDFLSKLLVLLAQNRVSTRRAAVLAYISQMLLRSLAAMDAEEAAADDLRPIIINDIPRPDRTPEAPPS